MGDLKKKQEGRLTFWDKELGSYLLMDGFTHHDAINYLGIAEDHIEKEADSMGDTKWTNKLVIRLLESVKKYLNDRTYHNSLEDLEQKINDVLDLTINTVEEAPAYCIKTLAKDVS